MYNSKCITLKRGLKDKLSLMALGTSSSNSPSEQRSSSASIAQSCPGNDCWRAESGNAVVLSQWPSSEHLLFVAPLGSDGSTCAVGT